MSSQMTKQVEVQITDLNTQLDESSRTIQELQSFKLRMQNESSDLSRQLEDVESNAASLHRERSNLLAQLDDARRSVDDETRVCI